MRYRHRAELVKEKLLVVEHEEILEVFSAVSYQTDTMIDHSVIDPYGHENGFVTDLNDVLFVSAPQIPLSHTVQLSFLRVPGLVPFSDSLSGHPWTHQAPP